MIDIWERARRSRGATGLVVLVGVVLVAIVGTGPVGLIGSTGGNDGGPALTRAATASGAATRTVDELMRRATAGSEADRPADGGTAPAAAVRDEELLRRPAPVAHATLEQELAGAVASAPANAVVGVSVTTGDGAVVYEHQAGLPMVPASTQKNIVAAAALKTFGPTHRLVTAVDAVGPVDELGVLHGSLVIRGVGDPTLSTDLYAAIAPDRPRTSLEALADAVAASGIRGVTGGVVGDMSVFANQPIAPGWKSGYIGAGHASPVSGLTSDGGRRVFLRNGLAQSVVEGNPAARTAHSLAVLLEQRGVIVAGPTSSAGRSAPEGGRRVGSVASPPLIETLRYMVQRSDNHLADALYRMVGAAAGDSTWAGSAVATQVALDGLRLRWDGVYIDDGSGLSRLNRVTPGFLSDLDQAMTASSHAADWRSLMALSGELGTLRGRLSGTVAHGRVWAKTGTLNDVRSLAGTVTGPAGERYHFTVIGNGLVSGQGPTLVGVQDALATALAADLERCAALPPTTSGFRCATAVPAPEPAPDPAGDLVASP